MSANRCRSWRLALWLGVVVRCCNERWRARSYAGDSVLAGGRRRAHRTVPYRSTQPRDTAKPTETHSAAKTRLAAALTTSQALPAASRLRLAARHDAQCIGTALGVPLLSAPAKMARRAVVRAAPWWIDVMSLCWASLALLLLE